MSERHPRMAETISASGDWWLVGLDPANALFVRGGDRPGAVRVSSASGEDLLRLLDDANRGIAGLPAAAPPAAIANGSEKAAALADLRVKNRTAKKTATKAAKAPRKPRQKKVPPPPPDGPPPGFRRFDDGAVASAASAGLAPVGDIIVITGREEEEIRYRGLTMELNHRQAALAAVLAKASPHPVDRKTVIARIFGAPAPASAEQLLSNLTTQLRDAVAGIGLNVVVFHGIGIALQPEAAA